jgi:pimeloyl-ACP methyl ester carboxylesterase
MSKTFLQRLRRAWAIIGSLLFVGFVGWCLLAYRAKPEAAAALRSDSAVTVTSADGVWTFAPSSAAPRPVNLVFLAGALVNPTAYAPLLNQIAHHGYRVYLLALPWRGAFGKADGPDFLDHVRSLMDTVPGTWVVAGHSRGAKIAALVSEHPVPRQTALILIGTTHPRDISLAGSRLAVTKIYGTADGVAPASKVLANRALLPATTRWVAIAGGNHHQFGAYGFQPGDHRASISAATQQALTVEAVLAALAAAPDAI